MNVKKRLQKILDYVRELEAENMSLVSKVAELEDPYEWIDAKSEHPEHYKLVWLLDSINDVHLGYYNGAICYWCDAETHLQLDYSIVMWKEINYPKLIKRTVNDEHKETTTKN